MGWNGSDGAASRTPQGDAPGRRQSEADAGTAPRRPWGVAPAKRKPARPPYRRGLLAGLVVVALGGAATWWICGDGQAKRGDAPDDGGRPAGRIADASPAAPAPRVAPPDGRKTNDKQQAEKSAAPAVPDGMVAVTNAGKVLFMTPKEAETFRRACRDTTLRTKTEKRLRLLASVPVGSPVPPMPGFVDMDADLQATLANKIEILPDDTPSEVEQKKFVMAFKEYMAEEIAAGKTANQVYEEYVQTMNKVAALTSEGSKMARELKAEGDLEGARKFLERVNAKIEEMGGNPIDLDRRPKGMSSQAKEQSR